jgi:hypothetical protein
MEDVFLFDFLVFVMCLELLQTPVGDVVYSVAGLVGIEGKTLAVTEKMEIRNVRSCKRKGYLAVLVVIDDAI